jgi:hypothetical protein
MQKSFLATPQKKTARHHPLDEPLKELSPLLLTVFSNSKMNRLEMMHSPLPTNKDLFYQLLATEIKPIPESQHENYDLFDDSLASADYQNSGEMDSEADSCQFEENDYEEDENGVKKRKRKSTNQIKMLKLELDSESNWNKDKIAEMSEITGLSQSQVYKWWWDQKKKNIKSDSESFRLSHKRKIIKKEYSHQHKSFSRAPSYEDAEERGVHTKAKAMV